MTFTFIAHTELSSAQAGILFDNIPTGFTDLVLVYSTRTNVDGDSVRLFLNGSDANFTGRSLLGSGDNRFNISRSDSIIQGTNNASPTTASTFSNARLYLPNYRSSNAKSFSVDGVTENNGTVAWQALYVGLWNQTAAITSIQITAGGGSNTFNQFSSATLYGVTAGSSGGVVVS